VVICLERGADLHMAQLIPLPLTVSCFSKIQIGFTFLVPAHPGSPGQRVVKRVCVYCPAYSLPAWRWGSRQVPCSRDHSWDFSPMEAPSAKDAGKSGPGPPSTLRRLWLNCPCLSCQMFNCQSAKWHCLPPTSILCIHCVYIAFQGRISCCFWLFDHWNSAPTNVGVPHSEKAGDALLNSGNWKRRK